MLGSFGRCTHDLEVAVHLNLVCKNPDPSEEVGGIWVRGINGQLTGIWKTSVGMNEIADNSLACKTEGNLLTVYVHCVDFWR